MSDKYYRKYGPIQRRKAAGVLELDETDEPGLPPPPRPPRPPLDEPTEPRRPYQRPRPRRRVVLPLLLLAIMIAAGLAGIYVWNLFTPGYAFDNVSIQGAPVGRMSRAAILAQLEARYTSFQRAPLTLEFEGRSWSPTLAELGATLDLARSADDAVGAGRQGNPLERVQQLWSIWQYGLDVPLRLTVDANRLQAYLTLIANQIEQPPRDAALSLAAGKVIATPAAAGRQILVDATTIELVRALHSLKPQTVVVRSRALTPALGDAAVAPAADTARVLLGGPLTIKRGNQQLTWNEEQIAALLNVTVTTGTMAVSVDPTRLERAVSRLAQVVDSPSAEPRVTLRNGKLTISQQGTTGWRLKQPEAALAISQTLQAAQRAVELPVDELKPQVRSDTLATLGIRELVGEGQTSFAGSAAYRITNIKAGAARMDGVLIAPDEEFSFNTQLGAVDAANGFVEGYAVVGNRTQLEWGGGVCQDSTTMFRAAFWAGLPITERHAHPFYISWYDAYAFPTQQGPGMDATIYTGVQDLKFVNDTGNWLLIDAAVDEAAQVVTMRLYGTKPDRTVRLVGPEVGNIVPPPASPVYTEDASLPAGTIKQTDTARRGMDISLYRIISDGGVERAPELFFTRFKAWPDVFVRGTGT